MDIILTWRHGVAERSNYFSIVVINTHLIFRPVFRSLKLLTLRPIVKLYRASFGALVIHLNEGGNSNVGLMKMSFQVRTNQIDLNQHSLTVLIIK